MTPYVLQQNIGRNLTEYVSRRVPVVHTGP
jgi:hypothetical protein